MDTKKLIVVFIACALLCLIYFVCFTYLPSYVQTNLLHSWTTEKSTFQDENILFEKIKSELKNGTISASKIHSNNQYNYLKSNPESRKKLRDILKDYPETAKATMISNNEPGEKLTIKGAIKNPSKGAVLYLFQTDNKGLYAPEHLKGGHGSNNPRLFCYVKPDVNGKFIINTIVPACYPGGSLKHIHYSLVENQQSKSGELIFDEPPHPPSESQKKWAVDNGFKIVTKQKLDGVYTVTISL